MFASQKSLVRKSCPLWTRLTEPCWLRLRRRSIISQDKLVNGLLFYLKAGSSGWVGSCLFRFRTAHEFGTETSQLIGGFKQFLFSLVFGMVAWSTRIFLGLTSNLLIASNHLQAVKNHVECQGRCMAWFSTQEVEAKTSQ